MAAPTLPPCLPTPSSRPLCLGEGRAQSRLDRLSDPALLSAGDPSGRPCETRMVAVRRASGDGGRAQAAWLVTDELLEKLLRK